MDKKYLVLVIEDDDMLLSAITQKLQINKVEVVPCESASKAFEFLESTHKIPDAIWLDYYLKESNGLEFMDKLKKNPLWEKIPVLVVSNSASPDKVNHMLALGASKYILKAEHRLDEIINIIEQIIEENKVKQVSA